jgi:hypothetical protein
MGSPWLRRSSVWPGGWASGGGDTDNDRQPQPITLTRILTGSTTQSFRVPKGTLILAGVTYPFPPTADPDEDSSHVAASAGTVSVGLTDGGTEFLNAATAANYTKTAYSNGYVVTTEKRIYCKPATAITGYVRAGIECILPATRK